LDRTVRLLEAALEEPELRLPRATALVDYHIDRNRVAKASHEKTWKKKHKGARYEWHFLKRNSLLRLAIDKDGLTCDKLGLLHNPRLFDKEAAGVSAYHRADP
jgi:hypothetical protein